MISVPNKTILTVIITVLVTTVVVGGSMYMYQKSQTDTTASPQPQNTTDATATPTPVTTADTVKQGWVRKTIPELNVAFDYPQALGDFTYEIQPFADSSQGSGTVLYGAIGSKQNDPRMGGSISFYADSKDFRTESGRGGGFLDYDGYEKTANVFSIFSHNWGTGLKEPAFPATELYNNPREVITKSFKALLVDQKEMEGPGGLQGDYGAIVPVNLTSNYYAITIESGDGTVSAADFQDMIKSFRSTK